VPPVFLIYGNINGLHSQLCGIFIPNPVNAAHMAAFNWYKSPTNCGVHFAKSNFQTLPIAKKINLLY